MPTTLPNAPTAEQYAKILPILIKKIIADPSNFGAVPDDISVETGNGRPTVASGQFVKKFVSGGKTQTQVYKYQLTQESGEFFLSYVPVSGVSDTPTNLSEPTPSKLPQMMLDSDNNQDWIQDFFSYVSLNENEGYSRNEAIELAEYQADVDAWFRAEIAAINV